MFVSIPQWCDCCRSKRVKGWTAVVGFNPTMVRLLLFFSPRLGIEFIVSIPQWCDCCQARRQLSRFGQQCFNPTMVRLLRVVLHLKQGLQVSFQSHNGAIAAKAKFWGLRAKWDKMREGLQSTFGCLKNLRGSTASDPLKLRHFWEKLPPRLYLAFKVLKRA